MHHLDSKPKSRWWLEAGCEEVSSRRVYADTQRATDRPTLAVSSCSNDIDMEVDHFTNGVTESSSNGFLNGSSKHTAEPDDCDADMGE